MWQAMKHLCLALYRQSNYRVDDLSHQQLPEHGRRADDNGRVSHAHGRDSHCTHLDEVSVGSGVLHNHADKLGQQNVLGGKGCLLDPLVSLENDVIHVRQRQRCNQPFQHSVLCNGSASLGRWLETAAAHTPAVTASSRLIVLPSICTRLASAEPVGSVVFVPCRRPHRACRGTLVTRRHGCAGKHGC